MKPKRTSFDKNYVNKHNFKKMKCECGREVMVDNATVSVRCYMCVVNRVPLEIKTKTTQQKSSSGFPRGWHLYKMFVTADGTVYEFGKENPKLKGKFKPTTPKVPEKISKWERRHRKEQKEIRKMKRLAKKHKEKMKKLKKK